MKKHIIAYTVCVFACLLTYSLFSASNGVLLTPMIEHYQPAQASQGLPASAQYIGCFAALAASFFLMGRIPKHWFLLGAFACAVLLILPLGFAPPFALYVALFGLLGVMMGTVDNLASSIVGDLYRGRSAGRMMNMLHATFGLGGILGPILYQRLLDGGMVWNRVYFLLFAFGLLVLAYTAVVCRGQNRLPPAVSARRPVKWADIRAFFASRTRSLLLAVIFFYAIFFTSVSTWGMRYIEVELGSAALGALALSLFWLGVAGGRLLMSALAMRPVPYLRGALLATVLLLLPAIELQNATVMCVAIVLSTLLNGAAIPQIILLGCQQYQENTLLATTVFFLGLNAGQSLGPLLAGPIAAAWGNGAVMFFAVGMIALAGVGAFLIPKQEKREVA